MQKIILDTIEEKKYICPKCGSGGNDLLEENSIDCHFCGVVDLSAGGAYQEGFKAGQKSREKEIIRETSEGKSGNCAIEIINRFSEVYKMLQAITDENGNWYEECVLNYGLKMAS
jgi:ribosomal protein L37AE/L43A